MRLRRELQRNYFRLRSASIQNWLYVSKYFTIWPIYRVWGSVVLLNHLSWFLLSCSAIRKSLPPSFHNALKKEEDEAVSKKRRSLVAALLFPSIKFSPEAFRSNFQVRTNGNPKISWFLRLSFLFLSIFHCLLLPFAFLALSIQAQGLFSPSQMWSERDAQHFIEKEGWLRSYWRGILAHLSNRCFCQRETSFCQNLGYTSPILEHRWYIDDHSNINDIFLPELGLHFSNFKT